jgi:hypothetical protein
LRSSVGPDADGNARVPVRVAVPIGRYELVSVEAAVGDRPPRSFADVHGAAAEDVLPPVTGCRVMRLPPAPRPQLHAHWMGHRRWFAVRVHATGVPAGESGDPFLHLDVSGRRPGGDRVLRYKAMVPMSSRGKLARRARVRIGRRIHRVCVRARFSPPGDEVSRPARPIRGQRRATFVELRR